ncbi:hypothetical protein GBAR_LOCUS22302, partial [Geodia barretti]
MTTPWQSLSGYICTLQAGYTTATPDSLLKSAVQYVSGSEKATAYCKTATHSSLTNTILVDVLTNTKAILPDELSLIEKIVRKHLLQDSEDQVVICCGAVNQAPISNAPKAIGSTLGSFTVNIWYPQCC